MSDAHRELVRGSRRALCMQGSTVDSLPQLEHADALNCSEIVIDVDSAPICDSAAVIGSYFVFISVSTHLVGRVSERSDVVSDFNLCLNLAGTLRGSLRPWTRRRRRREATMWLLSRIALVAG